MVWQKTWKYMEISILQERIHGHTDLHLTWHQYAPVRKATSQLATYALTIFIMFLPADSLPSHKSTHPHPIVWGGVGWDDNVIGISTWSWCYALWSSLAIPHDLDATLHDLHWHFHMILMLRSMIFIGISTWSWCYALWSSLAIPHDLDATLYDLQLPLHTSASDSLGWGGAGWGGVGWDDNVISTLGFYSCLWSLCYWDVIYIPLAYTCRHEYVNNIFLQIVGSSRMGLSSCLQCGIKTSWNFL